MSTKIPIIAQLQTAFSVVRDYVDSLHSNFVQVVAEAMTELEDAKADKPNIILATLSTSAWQDSDLAQYPKYCDITAQEVTAQDIVTVTIAPTHQATATTCGLCATCETLENIIRIWAESTPNDEILIEYTVTNGRNEA